MRAGSFVEHVAVAHCETESLISSSRVNPRCINGNDSAGKIYRSLSRETQGLVIVQFQGQT